METTEPTHCRRLSLITTFDPGSTLEAGAGDCSTTNPEPKASSCAASRALLWLPYDLREDRVLRCLPPAEAACRFGSATGSSRR
jgi:hypothetical protein